MSSVKGKDTLPELIVRSVVHRLGYRFRLHVKSLPGSPDIVLRRLRRVIFVNGCFWHGHKQCLRAKRPEQNKSFWDLKLDENIVRDRKNNQSLKKNGWKSLIIWTCEVNNPFKMERKIKEFLSKR